MAVTPPTDGASTKSTHATWHPRDIPYNQDYETSLQDLLLNPSANHNGNGLLILPDDSLEQPQPGISVRASDIHPDQLPDISFNELPLSLTDPRRIYASPIPGLRLTHPAGFLEGGPGPDPDDNDFIRDFVATNNIITPAHIHDARAAEIAKSVELATQRMKARREAMQHNARIEKEIKTLTDQRDMELKIETRMRDEAMARRERKEKKKEKRIAG